MSGLKSMVAAAALGVMALAGTASAEGWPEKNITMIVPFGAGGSIDRFARGLAQHWEARLDGVAVVVENRPGASGLLGAKTFLNAPADGHTIFVGIQPTLSMNTVVQNADFTLDDFAFVNFEQRDYGDIVVSADSRFDTLEDFVTEAKAKPGELSAAMILGGGTSLFGLALMQELEASADRVEKQLAEGGSDARKLQDKLQALQVLLQKDHELLERMTAATGRVAKELARIRDRHSLGGLYESSGSLRNSDVPKAQQVDQSI